MLGEVPPEPGDLLAEVNQILHFLFHSSTVMLVSRSIMMHGLSELLLGAARSEFEVFIEYCSNQAEQERTLKRLR